MKLDIGHLADSHLKETRYGHVKYGDDFFHGLVNAINASSPHVDVFVHVGDMFDSARPGPRVIGQLMKIHELLLSLKKKMFVVTGNHDWNNTPWFTVLFPSCGEYGIEPIDDRVVEYKGFKISGIRPHSPTSFAESCVEIRNLAKGADVVLYHGFVKGVVPIYVGDKVVTDVGDLPITDTTKAVLLGDIHIQGEVFHRGCLVSYPGSTEVVSDGEVVEKSVPVVTIRKDVPAEVTARIPFSTRSYISAEVRTEDQLVDFLARVKDLMPLRPVVVCKFDADIPSALQRLYAVADPLQCLLRPLRLPKNIILRGVFESSMEEEQPDDLTVADFVYAELKGENTEHLRILAEALIAQPSEAVGIVAEHVNQEKIKLQQLRC